MLTQDADFVSSLQSQIDALQSRVKELEAENAKLLSQLADCGTHEIEKKIHGSDEKGMKSKKGNMKTEEKMEKMPALGMMKCLSVWCEKLNLACVVMESHV
ncbi:tRNA pseudouridine(38/39) synthase [Senna tora]|uniref:tRNA pseudouridine(38/39) synthase n=1 Tax=Senna tora TaxID=362788 RepID=A0A834T177_9FABA|nr:tRNA pseudouridine(38/39) synthase [Senna tora]